MKNNDFSQAIKEWYTAAYPTDPLGPRLAGTFGGALQCLLSGGDVYGYVTQADSIVRERLFGKLSKMLEVGYNEITLFKKLGESGLCVVTATQQKGA